MKEIRSTEHTTVVAMNDHQYKLISSDYGETYGSVSFQNGPIKEVRVNGCQTEDLIAICIHRLEGFQSGGLLCEENDRAIFDLISAKSWLNKRTKDRQERNVEGTDKV